MLNNNTVNAKHQTFFVRIINHFSRSLLQILTFKWHLVKLECDERFNSMPTKLHRMAIRIRKEQYNYHVVCADNKTVYEHNFSAKTGALSKKIRKLEWTNPLIVRLCNVYDTGNKCSQHVWSKTDPTIKEVMWKQNIYLLISILVVTFCSLHRGY